MIINTERFKLMPLTTKYVTKKYLSWFDKLNGSGKYLLSAKKNQSIACLKSFVSERENKDDILFLGIFTQLNKHIGNLKYEPIDFENKSAILGILIGDKEWQGKGVANEVISATNVFLNEIYGIKYIDLVVNANNEPAVSLYKKMNFSIYEENDNELKMRLKL